MEAVVRVCLAEGDTRTAMVKARDLHKATGQDRSEDLLVEAYQARILALRERGLLVEAADLETIVRDRYPRGLTRRTVRQELLEFEAWIRPLAAPDLAPGERTRIEERLRREVRDPGRLACSDALPGDHPIRVAARALEAAFRAVTTGPVDPAVLELPEVSRRSPLADWKHLVRAIACFHRGEDRPVREHLGRIGAGSAPARLVPVMTAMIEGGGSTGLSPAGRRLVDRVEADRRSLLEALAGFDTELGRGRPGPVARAIANVMRVALAGPDGVALPLRQHLLVRIGGLRPEGRDAARIEKALGGMPPLTAAYWRLAALRMQSRGLPFQAVVCWDQFRRHALQEGRFREGSAEEATLFAHQADLLAGLGPVPESVRTSDGDRLRSWLGAAYRFQPPELVRVGIGEDPHRGVGPDLLDPDERFRLTCRIHPTVGRFRRWFAWGKARQAKPRALDRILDAWCEAFPQDAEPWIRRMELAEEREALGKALKFLEAAEARDRLDPGVERARMRLTLGRAIRHLKQKRADLARKDLEALEGLTRAGEADRPAFLEALGQVISEEAGRPDEARARRGRLEERLEGPLGAHLVVASLRRTCGLPACREPVPDPGKDPDPGALVRIVGRACGLLVDMGVPARLPDGWVGALTAAAGHRGAGPGERELIPLASTALGEGHHELAYAVSGAGLALGSAMAGRFLVLRARSLPGAFPDRIRECLQAARALGRQRRDAKLVDEVVEVMHRLGLSSRVGKAGWDHDSRSLDEELAAAGTTLCDELRRSTYPRLPSPRRGRRKSSMYCQDCGVIHSEEDAPVQGRLFPESLFEADELDDDDGGDDDDDFEDEDDEVEEDGDGDEDEDLVFVDGEGFGGAFRDHVVEDGDPDEDDLSPGIDPGDIAFGLLESLLERAGIRDDELERLRELRRRYPGPEGFLDIGRAKREDPPFMAKILRTLIESGAMDRFPFGPGRSPGGSPRRGGRDGRGRRS